MVKYTSFFEDKSISIFDEDDYVEELIGILLCFGLVENTLESSNDKKHLHIADIHIHQIMEHQRIYDDGDYDDYRYDRNLDYADGVDDAMDELGW